MTPPTILDSEGWPFKLLSRVPYRPDGLSDWRERIALEIKEAARQRSFKLEGVA